MGLELPPFSKEREGRDVPDTGFTSQLSKDTLGERPQNSLWSRILPFTGNTSYESRVSKTSHDFTTLAYPARRTFPMLPFGPSRFSLSISVALV